MSNSIWKTPDQKPTSGKCVCIYDGFEYYVDTANPDCWDSMFVEKWCDFHDLIAQADKAERLEKENEAMREEFEVWHENYKCEVEEKKRLQKAVEALKEFITKLYLNGNITDEQLERYKNTLKN